MDRRKPIRPQPYTKNYKQLRNAEHGRKVFSKEEHSNWLSKAKWSVPRAYIQVKLYRRSKLYLGIYIHTNMHIRAINKQRGSEFEKQQGGVYGRKEKGEIV